MSGDERLFAVTCKNHSVTRAPKSLDVAGGMGGLPKLLDNCKDYHFDLLEVERRNAGFIDLDELRHQTKLELREHRRKSKRKVGARASDAGEGQGEEERPKLEGRSSGASEKDQENGGVYEGDWKNDEQEGKFTYADGGVFEGDWKNDGREGGQEHVDVRRRVRVRGRLQERQDGVQVHVHRRGRVRGRLEERRAQEEGSQVELEDVERKRKAAKSGSMPVFPVGARAPHLRF